MNDEAAVIQAYLQGAHAIRALCGTRVHSETNSPPAGPPAYTPAAGPCLCTRIRGRTPDESDAIMRVSLQVKMYGATDTVISALYRAVYAALHNGHGGLVRWTQCEVGGQMLTEPGTQPPWPFMLAYFTVWVVTGG